MSDVVGIGIDVVEVARIRKALERAPDRFRRRVFTEAEVAYCEARRDPYPHYAARFAAKEAAMKALGTGWAGGIAFPEIEVVREPSGRPGLRLHGRARERLACRGGRHVLVSLSHGREYAVAQVLLRD